MASSAATVAEFDDDDHHHDEDLEHRLSGDRLLADEEPLVLDSVVSADVSKSVVRHKRWLLYLAAASSLLCMFTINFDLLFLSTNYSKRIASDLHQLSNAVWIILVGSITETASQPVYAYLSNNQGRKKAFLLAASLTTIDNVPLKDFALWRSLLIFVQMAGDVSGGPLGSVIADASSWQAVYGIETIVMLCGLAGASFSLTASRNPSRDSQKPRLDLLQIILLFVTIALPLFALNLGGDVLPWNHPAVIVLFSCTPVTLGGLILVTTNRSENSSMIKKLLGNSAVLALLATTFFVVYAFNALTYNMAVYIEARSFNNPSAFGDWALSCIFLSRPFGTFLAGLIIKRYRSPWILLRGNMIVWFTLYIVATTGAMPLEKPATAPYLLLVGLSLGVFESSLIVSLFATVQKKEQASFLATFNVVVAFAGDVGVGVSLALTQNFLKRGLYRELAGLPNSEEIISKALESLESIRNIPHNAQAKIIGVYMNSIEKVWAISCVTLLIGIVATISQRVVYREENEWERNDHVHAG
ncbi:MFS general substrate transporter [Annulohypoxylon moriforme]|nr:MFS general substrate transporter [Annulohypoxylon moriforme]